MGRLLYIFYIVVFVTDNGISYYYSYISIMSILKIGFEDIIVEFKNGIMITCFWRNKYNI